MAKTHAVSPQRYVQLLETQSMSSLMNAGYYIHPDMNDNRRLNLNPFRLVQPKAPMVIGLPGRQPGKRATLYPRSIWR